MNKNEAIKILMEQTPADRVINSYEGLTFFDFTVSCGGDIVAYRIYKETGKIYER